MSIKASLTELSVLDKDHRLITSLTRRSRQLDYVASELLRDHSMPQYLRALRQSDHIAHFRLSSVIQLDNLKVVSPHLRKQSLAELAKGGKTYRELRENFGLDEKPAFVTDDPLLKLFLEKAAKQSIKARECDLKSRLADECMLAHSLGWYFVFNTLTIDDDNMEKVFCRKSKIFSDYIRKVTRSVGKSLGYDKLTADKKHNTIHRYFAVVEYGSTTARRHVHVLHLIKKLPYGSTDPNSRTGFPVRRQLESFRPLWRYGFSSPIAVRYSADDAFSRLGYRYPMEEKNGIMIPIKTTGIMAVAHYVSKYITKQQGVKLSWQNQNINLSLWRTRMTRQFGMLWILKRLQSISTKTLRRSLQENKSRILPRSKSPSWTRIRKGVLIMLAQRKALRKDFLTSKPAAPMCLAKRMNKQKLIEMLSFPSLKFGISRQRRIDMAISDIIQILQLSHYSMSITGRFSDNLL